MARYTVQRAVLCLFSIWGQTSAISTALPRLGRTGNGIHAGGAEPSYRIQFVNELLGHGSLIQDVSGSGSFSA